MSSLLSPRDHLLTLAEWDALPEDVCRRAELVEGVLVASPAPTVRHQLAVKRLMTLLDRALPTRGYECVPSPDVVVFQGDAPTVRSPDVVVVAAELIGRFPKRLAAADVVLAVEIVSPGSRRTDRIAKLADYAEGGIAEYWIINIDEVPSLETFRLTGDRYELTAEPLVTIDVGRLLD